MFIDITRVESLRTHSIGAEYVTLGGNISLTETMEVLKKASMRSGFHYLKYFVEHIDLIANVPVRNVNLTEEKKTFRKKLNENIFSLGQ